MGWLMEYNSRAAAHWRTIPGCKSSPISLFAQAQAYPQTLVGLWRVAMWNMCGTKGLTHVSAPERRLEERTSRERPEGPNRN